MTALSIAREILATMPQDGRQRTGGEIMALYIVEREAHLKALRERVAALEVIVEWVADPVCGPSNLDRDGDCLCPDSKCQASARDAEGIGHDPECVVTHARALLTPEARSALR